MPIFNDELQKQLDAKQVVLGGCCITGDDPTRHCNQCGFEWDPDWPQDVLRAALRDKSDSHGS
jgi:hypothetical protein